MSNVIITGASKGMGRAIAIAFAKQGSNLAICSRNEGELSAFRDELLTINPAIKVAIRKTDTTLKAEVKAFAAFAEAELGFIDVIVNNVGTYIHQSILDDADDTFQNLINTNLMPGYELYRYFGKKLAAAKKGHIFNTCSVAALNPVAEAGMYTVTKFAVLGLSNIMRLEMQQHTVKVTTILPGSTFTESWKGSDLSPDKFVSPDDIAAAIISAYNMSAGANVDEIIIKPVSGQL
ncbi:SDR family oxidoreductase [Mucilaginibacter sp. HMF5004]|uniref:SDR family oxidoreductase n=1 Tax=Mucilaginibacter rivuli TaxID=2857527 RepID=UPI001C5EE809|nr:SDR family oxidoreductase [Mucilaginibacter rivuli]MBW4890986.1 SDR family oxidoreductase [Mucilaginibacter rivuli]